MCPTHHTMGPILSRPQRYAADDSDLISVEGCPAGFAPPSPAPPPPLRKKQAKKLLAAASVGDLTVAAPPAIPSPAFHAYVGGKAKPQTSANAHRLSHRLLTELSECSSRGIVAPENVAVCTLAARAGLETRALDEAHVGVWQDDSPEGKTVMDSKAWAAEIAKGSNKLYHPVP